MIFLTVGTQFPFDRLVRTVDRAVGSHSFNDNVFAQIGKSKYIPQNMMYAEILDANSFDSKIKQADFLISHAGIGSITTALRMNKPLLVMPRLRKFREHVNDHQVATARKFEELGHILVAYCVEELPETLQELKSFVPKPRKNQVEAVTERIAQFLNELRKEGKRR
jgi:UDP-N-acetylglucosamine transferase subunit ALG13